MTSRRATAVPSHVPMTSRTLVLVLRYGKRGWRTLVDIVRFALRRADEEKLFQVAGSLTFTTALSIVPLLTTVFGVMTAFPVFERMRDALHSFLESKLLPDTISKTIFGYLDQFSANASSLTIVSLLSFAVTSVLTLLTIDNALNTIWGVRRPRPLPQRIVTYWAILSMGPILLGISLSLTSYLASVSAGFVDAPPPLTATLLDVAPLVLFAGSYTALYVFVPNRHVELRDALVGALLAAFAFEAAKRGFAAYVAHARSYTMVYGALAALPLTLLWIYYIWIITLAGALVAASLPAIYGRNWNRGRAPGEAFGDALRVLRVLYRARRSDRPGHLAGLDVYSVRRRARLDYYSADVILETLEQDGLVIRARQVGPRASRRGRDDDVWVFVADSRVVRLERVFRLFAFDAAHVAEIGMRPDDPLSRLLRAQRLAHGDEPLERALVGDEASGSPLVERAGLDLGVPNDVYAPARARTESDAARAPDEELFVAR